MYPGYQGALTDVDGAVKMTLLPDGNGAGSVMVEAVLYNVDPRCSEHSDAPNGCGIHIHSGYDCADASTIKYADSIANTAAYECTNTRSHGGAYCSAYTSAN